MSSRLPTPTRAALSDEAPDGVPSLPLPYAKAAEHLHDLLTRARLELRIATLAHEHADAFQVARCESERAAIEHRIAARVTRSPLSVVPLERLRQTFRLSSTEIATLVLLVGVEIDLSIRNAVIALMDHASRVEVDVALLDSVLYTSTRERVPEEFGEGGRLTRFGLVRVQAVADEIFALRRVRVTDRVLHLLHGKDTLGGDVARIAALLPASAPSELVLDGDLYDELGGLVASAVEVGKAGGQHPVVLLTGADGAGRKTLLASCAARLGLRTLRINAAALPHAEADLRRLAPALLREVTLFGAMPLMENVDRSPAGTALDALLFEDYAGPLVATAGRITGKPPAMARGLVTLDVPVPSEATRVRLWHRALADDGAALSRWAAERYSVTPGAIDRAANAALAKAAARGTLDPSAQVSRGDVHEGLRSVLDAKLATLGMRITWRQSWEDLVLPEDATLELREFIARVRHRRRVYEDWGFGQKVAKGMGLSALFSGPPGTGKTMAAGLIAQELGLDLYQIDLSKVVSKWVGETEKNLGELFDAAEAGHAILLFDEADSLFAKRTQVQSSNDRYANLEVNYLLQRLEAFAGIVVLTTNHETAIDEAFRRRLSLRIDFPIPDAAERERLWRALLPNQAEVERDLDFAVLAARFEMTGGYIKNAVVRAAFLAADDQSPIAMRHLLRAARAEYQAMGKVISHL